MSQTRTALEPEAAGRKRWNPLRPGAFKLVVVLCVVALVAVGGYALWSRQNQTPQPYGGAATANDTLMTVGDSPWGGV